MIKLKTLLFENQLTKNNDDQIDPKKNDDQIDPKSITGTLISTTGGSDPYEYYLHNNNQKWYTKKRANNIWLDMKTRLIRRFGNTKGSKRYQDAINILNKFIVKPSEVPENLVITDIHVDPSELPKTETLKTIPTDLDIHIDRIFAKDLDIPIENVKFDDKWIQSRTKKNAEVEILAKTPQHDYLRVILPHRGLRTNVEAWVSVSDFDIYKTDSGFIGKPTASTGNKFKIYKPKQKK